MKKFWTKEMSPADSLHIARVLALYEAKRAGPAGAALYDLIDRSDWQAVVDFDFKYESGVDPEVYIHLRQALAFLTKNIALKNVLPGDLEAEAYKKFLQSETRCGETNALFRSYQRGQHCWTPAFEQVLYLAKWKVEKILGSAPNYRDLELRLGPGACTRIKRARSTPAEKLMSLACSVDFVPYLSSFVAENYTWLRENAIQSGRYGVAIEDATWTEALSLSITEEFGRLTFVEKDAKSKRTIVIEPNVNQMHQLALGKMIATRLKRNGIDISSQETNQCLARYGSLSGALATLDLSSASDSVSTELVRFLVPDDWFALMQCFRCSSVTYRGREISLEKFSSMGNGFTFPLETLIFYALCWASVPHHKRSWLNAYGDDLVVPADCAETCVNTLTGAGFVINTDKSHVAGPFRESCGADYFLGVNIRPFYLKRLVSQRVLFSAYNFFQERMDTDMLELLTAWIDPRLVLWGPPGFGDGHLVSDEWYRKPHRRKDGWAGYLFYTYTLKAVESKDTLPGDYLEILYRLYSDDVDPSSLLDVMPPTQRSIGGALKKVFPTVSKSERLYRRIAVYTLMR